MDPEMCLPFSNGGLPCTPGAPDKNRMMQDNAVVGNVMQVEFYGSVYNLGSWAGPGLNASLKKFWGVPAFAATLYNYVLFAVLRLRSLLRGADNVSPVPELKLCE